MTPEMSDKIVTKGQIAPHDGYCADPADIYDKGQHLASHDEIVAYSSLLWPNTSPPKISQKRKPPTIAG